MSRGTSVDEYGDEIDTPIPVITNVLGSIIEQRRTEFNPGDSRVASISFLTGRFNKRYDIQDGDTLTDEKTGETYGVQAVMKGNDPINKSDLVLDLIRT